ncbi:response regulator [Sphingobium cloacae]|uniref:Response regulator n=2 Tax=Sphingobium cloacae TaxID=120107 RepID=A0A1E1F4Y7_9SPHN|nr:response regulator [Sphingobium cloacae]
MLRPGVGHLHMALVDINLPDGSGIEIIRQVAAGWPDAIAAVATIYGDDLHLMEAIAAGARGYLLKGDPPDILRGCLQRLARGEPATSPAIALRILAHFRQSAEKRIAAGDLPHQRALSRRETEVLDLLARGYTIAESARRLGLSSQTVSTYVRTIYSKLSVNNRAQAVVEARRRGLG